MKLLFATLILLLQVSSIEGKWEFVGGSNTTNTKGIYGTMGVYSKDSTPGARHGSVYLTSASSFWLFGGDGYDANGNYGELNDLWELIPHEDSYEWIWQNGSQNYEQNGNYSGYGESGMPGGRYDAAGWVDPIDDSLWIFGGHGYSESSYGYLNDLWNYEKGKGWVWIAGNSTNDLYGVYDGNLIYPGSRYGAATWTDKEGGLWLFGGYGYGKGSSGSLGDIWRFNNTKWEFIGGTSDTDVYANYSKMNPTPNSLYYAQVWHLSDGLVWIYGGEHYYYYNNVWSLNSTTKGFQWKHLSGSNDSETSGNYGMKGVPNVNNTLPGRYGGMTGIDSQQSLWVFGGYYYGEYNDLWRYSESEGWVWIDGSNQTDVTTNYTSSSPYPGGRYWSTMWIDQNNTLWVFGGYDGGNDFNDLWRYPLKLSPNPTSSSSSSSGTGTGSSSTGSSDSSIGRITTNLALIGGFITLLVALI